MIKQRIDSWSEGQNHIFFYYEKRLNGVFIVFLTLKPHKGGYEMWKQFVSEYEDIYFKAADPSYIGNHCIFHGYLGKHRVYRYAR